MQLDVHDINIKKVGTVDLPEAVFGADVSKGLLYEAVKAHGANARRGTAKVKNRGEVRGGGRKPLRQKGSGSARQGSSRSPIMVGGGIVFGPKPRDYSYRLPRSARRSALRSALSLRLKEEQLVIIDKLDLEQPKTKTVAGLLEKLSTGSALLVDATNENLNKSARNLPKAKYVAADGLNVYDILNHDKLVLTQGSLDAIIAKATGDKGEQAEA